MKWQVKKGIQYFQEENGNGNLCIISNVSELVFTYRNGEILIMKSIMKKGQTEHLVSSADCKPVASSCGGSTPPLSTKMSDKEFEDSILNAYICEMSEGMMSLSHVG